MADSWVEIKDTSLRKGFAQIPNVIMRDPGLSMQAKYLYGLLLGYAWQDPDTFPGLERLRADTGSKVDTLRKYLRELEKAKLLKIVQRGLGKTNRYIFLSLSGRYGKAEKGVNRNTPNEVVLEHPQRGVSGEPPEGGTTNTQSNEYAVYEDSVTSPRGADAPSPDEKDKDASVEETFAERARLSGEKPAKAMNTLTVDRTREVGFDAVEHQIANWGRGWARFVYVSEGEEPPSPERQFAVLGEIVAAAAGRLGAHRFFLSVEDAVARVEGGTTRQRNGRENLEKSGKEMYSWVETY